MTSRNRLVMELKVAASAPISSWVVTCATASRLPPTICLAVVVSWASGRVSERAAKYITPAATAVMIASNPTLIMADRRVSSANCPIAAMAWLLVSLTGTTTPKL